MLDDVSPDMYSAYGQPNAAQTPNVDKLAERGVMFKTCYASAMCGPSRVEIMTGLYGTTTGVTQNGLWAGNSRTDVYKDHQAFGKLLKDKGYATAIAGKWHAGMQMPYEKEIGFEEYCLWEGLKEINKLPGKPKFNGLMEDEKTTSRYWHPGVVKNGKLLNTKPTDYGPNIFADFIMDFMERKTKSGQPFLAYWPSVAPHGTRTGCPTNPDRGEVGDLGGNQSSEENKTRFKSLNEYIDGLVGKIVSGLYCILFITSCYSFFLYCQSVYFSLFLPIFGIIIQLGFIFLSKNSDSVRQAMTFEHGMERLMHLPLYWD